MSKNIYRSKLKKAITSKEYSLILLNSRYPIYWDEGLHFKKGHTSTKYRSYKTWKHSRKTQWKIF